MPLLEIATFTPPSAQTASQAGADRLELSTNRDLGGTTPSRATVHAVKQEAVKIPVYAMLRPRGGGFAYTDAEFEGMKAEMDGLKALQVDGFVFGILKDRGSGVDVERTGELVRRAGGLPCTFHRAFDECEDLCQALEDVVAAGCRAILTSGGALDVEDGTEMLCRLVECAAGRVEIIPGGGVRSTNLGDLHASTGAGVFHSSALVDGGMEPDPDEIRQMKKLLCRESNIM